MTTSARTVIGDTSGLWHDDVEESTRARRLAACGAGATYLAMIAGKYSLGATGPDSPGLPVVLIGIPALLAILLGPMAVELRERRTRLSTGVFRAAVRFFVIILMSVVWSVADQNTALQAMWIVLLIMGLLLLSASVQLSPTAAVDTFMWLSAVTGVIFAAGGLLSGAAGARLSAFGGGPNVFARITGIGIIAAIYLMLRAKRWWLLFMAAIPLLAVATVLSGSRGGMLGTVVGVLVVCIALSRRQWMRVALCVILAAPVMLVMNANFGQTVQKVVAQRIFKLTLEEGYTAGRGDLWSSAYDLLIDRPLVGGGLGTFITEHGFYAHNLVLQAGADAGMLGLTALLLTLGFIAAKVGVKSLRNPLVGGPAAAGVTIFVSSMFSGDYYDSRFFWAYMMLAVGARTVNAGRPKDDAL